MQNTFPPMLGYKERLPFVSRRSILFRACHRVTPPHDVRFRHVISGAQLRAGPNRKNAAKQKGPLDRRGPIFGKRSDACRKMTAGFTPTLRAIFGYSLPAEQLFPLSGLPIG